MYLYSAYESSTTVAAYLFLGALSRFWKSYGQNGGRHFIQGVVVVETLRLWRKWFFVEKCFKLRYKTFRRCYKKWVTDAFLLFPGVVKIWSWKTETRSKSRYSSSWIDFRSVECIMASISWTLSTSSLSIADTSLPRPPGIQNTTLT